MAEMEEEIMAEMDDDETGISLFNSAVQFVSSNGWFIFFTALILLITWKKKLEPYFLAWRVRRSQDSESAYMHKDIEAFVATQSAMEANRMKLQQQMDAAAELHREKLKQKEEEKRLSKIATYENLQNGRSSNLKKADLQRKAENSGPGQKKEKGSSLRGDYNPLMGSSSNSCFRPSRRGTSGGG